MTVLRRSLWRRASDPAVLALTDQAVVSGCNFVSTLIIARELPAPEFGLFSLAFMSCLFLSNLHRAALTQPLNVLGASEDGERIERRLAALLRLHGLALPLAACLMALASLLFFPDVSLAGSAIAYFGCFALQETLRRYWYTRACIAEALRIDILSYGGQVLALLVLAELQGLRPDTALLAIAATSLLAFVAGLGRIGPAAFGPPQPLAELVGEHRPMAQWLLLTVLAIWGAGQVYPLLLAHLGAAAVASFVACRTLLNATAPIVQSIGNYIPTQAAALLRTAGRQRLRRQIGVTCTLALAAGAVFLLLLHVYAEPLLHLLYKGRYDHAAPVLQVLAYGTVCSLLGAVLGAYALAMEDSRSSFFSYLGASATTFTLGLWLIDAHGVWGAALGAVLTSATAAGLQAGFVFRRLRRLHG